MSIDERKDPAPTTADLRRPAEHAVSQPDAPRGAAAAVAVFHDGVQVDVGGYHVHQGDLAGPIIADLFVHVDPVNPRNLKLLIEHWALYPRAGWVTPSDTNRRPPALAFEYVEKWENVDVFRSYLREKARTTELTYVQARCETMDP